MSTTLEATIHGRTFRLAAPDAEARALAEAIAVVEAECALIAQSSPPSKLSAYCCSRRWNFAAKQPAGDMDPRIETRLAAMTANLRQTLADTQSR